MDLGINGRNALVCAGSKGLGRACAYSLVREGVNVVIVARNPETLEKTANELKQLKAGQVSIVVADITTPQGRTAALKACPQPDILINNAGGPPAGDFRESMRTC
jgi:3-oxoacyl-[acyl-carrier protein] reductase